LKTIGGEKFTREASGVFNEKISLTYAARPSGFFY